MLALAAFTNLPLEPVARTPPSATFATRLLLTPAMPSA